MEYYVGTIADIIVRSANNHIKLVVEVKGLSHSSAEWAAKFRHNLLVNHVLPKSKFFLLALPDFLYLWKNRESSGIIPADYTVKTLNVLQKYLTRLKTEPKYIAKEGLELALTSWLREATFSSERPPVGSDSFTLLVESGLIDEIHNAEVIAQAHL